MVAVCVELEVILVLMPGLFCGGVEEFFLVEFKLAVDVVITVVVGLEVFLFCFMEGFGFDDKAGVLDVLEDVACSSHEAIEEDSRVGGGWHLGEDFFGFSDDGSGDVWVAKEFFGAFPVAFA